ncbi:MAG: radical SAM protein [Pseudomonadota bacterium]
MKIVLCNPEVRLKYSHSRKGMYPPLGLLSIATMIEQAHIGCVDIQIIDGDVESIDPVVFQDAELIGFHANSFNYENCLSLAQKAKEYGASIILGGPHADVLWENIMEKRSFIDFIVSGEGELTMVMLVDLILKNRVDLIELEKIPNLVFRRADGKAKKAALIHVNSPEEMITPSRKFIDVDKYIANYRKIYSKESIRFERPLSIYSSKGCSWRDKTGGCIFCARLERGVRFRNIPEIWNEISDLKEKYKTDYIWDISDDNLNSTEWFKQFVDQRPESLSDVSFLIYSRVNRITDDIIPYLKKLNVYEVYLGIESGDDTMLKNTMKGASAKLALNAARRLKDAGIYYFPSFVLGLPGESEKSLENSLKFAEDLARIGSIFRMSATILMPIPGSQVFSMMKDNPSIDRELFSNDIVSIKDLEKQWIEHYTDTDYATLEKYQQKINEIIQKESGTESFGKKIDK